MLSIAKLGSSGQAASYYEKADYYTKGEDGVDISSSYQGELANEFGLEGPVDKKQFTDLLNGITPDGEQIGTTRNGKLEHTPGWDLTFSAPKSASILALVGDDKRLIKAHHEAVQTALKILEKDILKTRMNVGGIKAEIDVAKALFATFTHTTSRSLDPQLHTHSVLLNMVQSEFGDMKSVHSRNMYDHAMLLGQAYRNEYANLIKDLGYAIDWDNKKGTFEIAGVPKQAIDAMSKRSQEIDKAAKEQGIETAKGRDKINVATRDKKQDIGSEKVIEGWDKELNDLNIDPKELQENARNVAKQREQEEKEFREPKGMLDKLIGTTDKPLNAVEKAVEQLSYYEAAFFERDLLKQALEFGRENVTYKDVKADLEKMKKLGTVMPSRYSKGFVTTKEGIRQENYILKVEKDNRGAVNAIADMGQINKKMEGYGFSDGQKDGFVHLLRSEDRFTGLQGHAGVGKTYMFKPFVELAQENGYEVKAVAPMGKAADNLGAEIGAESNTLAALLLDLDKEYKKYEGQEITEKPFENRIYIVDEASSINSRDMAHLETQVSRLGGRAILGGDRVQLPGVEKGKPFAQMMDNGMKTSVNQDILRQKDSPVLKGAIDAFYDRNFEKAFKDLDEKIFESKSGDERLKKFVSDYRELKVNGEKHSAVIFRNETRHQGTELLRSLLKKDGEIGKQEISVNILENAMVDGAKKSMAQYYEPGMQVRFLQEYKSLEVDKDSYYKVIRSNTREVVLSDGKREFKWQPDKIAGNRESGGVTTYKKRQSQYSIGDEIRFKDRNNQEGYLNGNTGKVVAIKDGNLVVELDKNGKSITLDPNNMRHRHFEHGYFDTAYVSQGATGFKGQVLIDSNEKNLTNENSVLVGITRPKTDIRLYVDDKNKVVDAVKTRSAVKQGALDHTNKRPESYMPFDRNKGTSLPDHLNQVKDRTTELKDKPEKPLDTFVSKPPEREPQLPKQVDREKTFLP